MMWVNQSVSARSAQLSLKELSSVRPSQTVNDPPVAPPYNVCFNLNWQKQAPLQSGSVGAVCFCVTSSSFCGTFLHKINDNNDKIYVYCVCIIHSGLQWLKLGANISNFSFSPSTILFHVGHAGQSYWENKNGVCWMWCLIHLFRQSELICHLILLFFFFLNQIEMTWQRPSAQQGQWQLH